MDVDTASYAIAQRYVADGNTPDPASVRIEEWVNAFDQGYPAPTTPRSASTIDGAPSPFLASRDVLLRVGIQARDSSERKRPAAALTFVIDTSGSMAREDRLELVKDSLRLLVRGLGRGDSIAVVTFGDDARVVLPPTRRPTTTGSWPPSTSSSRAARPTSRPASRSATSWRARPCSAATASTG